MPSNTQWYYSQGGRQLGPVSEDQLRQMKATGQVGPADLVWSEGMIDWLPAGQVPQLQAPAAAQSAVPPMPQSAAPVQGQWGAQGTANPQYGSYPQPAYGGYRPPQSGQSQQTLAIVGFIFSFVMPVVGMILSIIALSAMKTHGNDEGKGFATAGLVISIVLIVLGCLGFALCGMVGSMH